jgi:hypothetical protein
MIVMLIAITRHVMTVIKMVNANGYGCVPYASKKSLGKTETLTCTFAGSLSVAVAASGWLKTTYALYEGKKSKSQTKS